MRVLGIDLSYAGRLAFAIVENGKLCENMMLHEMPKKTTKGEKHLYTSAFDVRDYARYHQVCRVIKKLHDVDLAVIEYPAAKRHVALSLFQMVGMVKAILANNGIPFVFVYTSQVRKILAVGRSKDEAQIGIKKLFPSLVGKEHDLVDAYSFAASVDRVLTKKVRNVKLFADIHNAIAAFKSLEEKGFKRWKSCA